MKSGFFEKKRMTMCVAAAVVMLVALSTVFVVCQDSNDSEATLTTFDDGNLRYTITSAVNHEVSVKGAVTQAFVTTGTLTIPSSVTHNSVSYTVTSIGNDAFFNYAGFTGPLTIPDSVTTIGSIAFMSCSGFTGPLTIPDSVTTIGDYAFNRCSGFTGPLTIPDSVTSIGDFAFNYCSSLMGSLTIPNGVTSIGDYVFADCSSLTGSLTIPNGVTSIGDYAFARCSGFTGLNIPDSVTSIGDRAFQNCIGLTSITIPSSVTTLGLALFSSFQGIKFYAEDGITLLSQTVENLCGYTFEGTYQSMIRQDTPSPISPVSSTYTVSFSSGYGYMVSYTSDTVSSGGSVTFSVSVSEGYILNPVTATNGMLSHYSSGYMLSDITADSYVNITAYSQSSTPDTPAGNSADDSSYAAVGVAVVAAMICLIAALTVFFKKD